MNAGRELDAKVAEEVMEWTDITEEMNIGGNVGRFGTDTQGNQYRGKILLFSNRLYYQR